MSLYVSFVCLGWLFSFSRHNSNSRFWRCKNTWKYPQVSLKCSPCVTRTAVCHLLALLAVTISFMSGCKSQLIMLLWCATFSTNVSLGCICGFSGRLTANIMSLQLGWILAYYKYIGIWKCCQTWIDIKTPVKMINQLS